MLTYKILQQKPQSFKNLTGISIGQFDKLHDEITSVWVEGEQKRLTRPNRRRTIGGGRNYAVDLQHQLLMALLWLHYH